MDPYSSGEELVIKTRKPYTITKQRERWTEEEHNRFLEALKLYGRAWQRIEEHIGTKTAVQIRSHAQKFFTKLEKEALVKGVPVRQALDIEIPPPRPKRKPSNPYPRKISNGRPAPKVGSNDEAFGRSGTPITSVTQARLVLNLEKEPLPEKPSNEKFASAKENDDEDKNSKTSIILQEFSSTSPASANKSLLATSVGPSKSCAFKKFVPVLNEEVNKDETNESYVTVEPRAKQFSDKFDAKQLFHEPGTCDSTNLANSHPLNEISAQGKNIELDQSENFDNEPKNDGQETEKPRRIPVHILNGSLGTNATNVLPQISFQESMFHQINGVHPNLFMNLSSSTTSEHRSSTSGFTINQPFPGLHPISTPIQNQVDYQSFLHASSTFSSLIVSALLQNPAAHAAASFAASFWPCSNMEAPTGSPAANSGGVLARHINTAPSMGAIAAATVAAATAWWAAHGLLPLCAPFHMIFNNAPASQSTFPIGANQAGADNNERRGKTDDPALETQQMEPELSGSLQEQLSTSKTQALSLSDSEESNRLKLSDGSTAFETKQHAAVTEVPDLNKAKSRKQVDRSSCGSNTSSSSEVETDALEKHDIGKEELRELAVNHPVGELINRRGRCSCSSNDSWKEVSEEGRLAFQALFSREVLPQSFSPPYDSKNKEKNNIEKDEQKADEKDAGGSQSDLNGKTWSNCPGIQEVGEKAYLTVESNIDGGLLTVGKLRVRRTGFKPYKRCSMEAKEGRVGSVRGQDEEKGPKRIRLEGEAAL